MKTFVKAYLDVIAGGIVFAILGLLGFHFESRILWAVSIVGVFCVSLQKVFRASRENTQLNSDFNRIVGCFRKCIVRKTPGMEIGEVTITYKIDPVGNRDFQERRYVIHTGQYGANAKHVYIGSYRDSTEYGRSFKASLVRTLQLEAEDVTPLEDDAERKRLNVCAVPYTVDNKSLYVALGFDPPMQPNEVREIHLRVLRQGLWSELRAKGTDPMCSYTTSEIPTGKLRIQAMLDGESVVAKPGELRIIPAPESAVDTHVESRHSDAAARTVALWDIPDPEPKTTYRYGVECDPLKPLKIPLRTRVRRAWAQLLRKKL